MHNITISEVNQIEEIFTRFFGECPTEPHHEAQNYEILVEIMGWERKRAEYYKAYMLTRNTDHALRICQ